MEDLGRKVAALVVMSDIAGMAVVEQLSLQVIEGLLS